MTDVRVYQLARELGVPYRRVLEPTSGTTWGATRPLQTWITTGPSSLGERSPKSIERHLKSSAMARMASSRRQSDSRNG